MEKRVGWLVAWKMAPVFHRLVNAQNKVLIEKLTAACLQLDCNVTDIEHDFDSISDKIGRFLPDVDRPGQAN